MPEAPLIVRGGRAFPPREAERVLLSHPAVAEVAVVGVVGVPDRFWGEIVGAEVRLSAPLPSAAAGLAEYCRAFIVDYQVPERWLFTSALPRTPDGQVRRATVAARLAVSGTGTGAPSAPAHPMNLLRPRAAIEDLRIPQQVRRSWALEDL